MFKSAYLSCETLIGAAATSVCGWDEYMIYKAISKNIYGGDAALTRWYKPGPLRWQPSCSRAGEREFEVIDGCLYVGDSNLSKGTSKSGRKCGTESFEVCNELVFARQVGQAVSINVFATCRDKG